MRVLSILFASSIYLIALVATWYLSSHTKAYNDIISGMVNSSLLKPVGNFISGHKEQTLGTLLVGTSAITTTPASYGLGIFILIALLIYELLPAASYLEYFILSLWTGLFFGCRGRGAKFITLILIVVTCAAGLWGSSFLTATK